MGGDRSGGESLSQRASGTWRRRAAGACVVLALGNTGSTGARTHIGSAAHKGPEDFLSCLVK